MSRSRGQGCLRGGGKGWKKKKRACETESAPGLLTQQVSQCPQRVVVLQQPLGTLGC